LVKKNASIIIQEFRKLCGCKLIIISILCLGSSIAYAQNKHVSGVIKESHGKVLPHANIALKNHLDYIITFSQSNLQGMYTIKLPDTSSLASLFIEVSCVGFKKMQLQLLDGKNTYDFSMEEEAVDLKEVGVRSRPIIVATGDTLSYNVGSFSRPEDRSIGDVIKRLPGVMVEEDGRISFNGKPINNLYIHGDDLMDGRYGLATKVISKDMIKNIDVIEHFQPINVLKNKLFTDDVAMNLVLKNEHSIKLAGQAMLGAGFPEQYDAALSTMMFNKKIKVLNSLKANNSGVDIRNDFAQLGSSGSNSDLENPKPNHLLTLGTIGNPNLPKANYYLNNSKLLNANNLINFNNGLQIKSNIQLFLDHNRLNYANRLDNYLEGDTIRYNESQSIKNKPYTINSFLTATVNKNSYFLNNKLGFNFDVNKASGYMNFNGQQFNQDLSEKNFNVFNDFNYTPALKNSKNVIDLRWYVSYFANPQRLNVGAGLNAEVLNEEVPYSSASQHLQTPTFFSNATIAYRIFNDHLIQQSYQMGIMNERQQFNSMLNLTQINNTVTNYGRDIGNDLSWKRDRMFANAEYAVKKQIWRASLSLPLIVQSIRYQQHDYDLDEKKNQFLISPNANLTVYLNAEDYFALKYSFNTNLGKISNVYRGAILSNYRTTYANNADLQQQRVSNLALDYNFKRSIIMLFAAARIDYKKVTANTIASSELTANVQRTVLLPYQNDQSSVELNADISKYIFALNTTVSANAVLSRSNYNQLINTQVYPFNNNVVTLKAKIESKLFDGVTLSYSGIGLWAASKQKPVASITANIDSESKRFDQSINLGYSPIDNFFVNLTIRNIYGRQSNISNINYVFMDIKARYKLVKWRTDLELDISNLANIKNYEVFSISSNQLFISRYEIRGRMSVLRATFNF